MLARYLDLKIVERSPFETIDRPGVGWLVRLAAWVGREAKPDLKLGICGEHGGDPESIAFFQVAGLDYVSCSPYRVPIARVAAAQAAHGSPRPDLDWPPMLRTALLTLVLFAAIATAASAHLERPSYWPDPRPDTSVKPAAGGKVPAARSFYSALRKAPPGTTRVVCTGKVPSTKRVKRARKRLRAARRRGASKAQRRVLKRKIRRAKRRYRRAVLRNASIRNVRASIRNRLQERLQVPALRELAQAVPQGGQAPAEVQHAPARALQVQGDPAGGQRLAQQRPRRDPARPLHRAGLAQRRR